MIENTACVVSKKVANSVVKALRSVDDKNVLQVNLLASKDSTEEQSHGLRSYPFNSMGG